MPKKENVKKPFYKQWPVLMLGLTVLSACGTSAEEAGQTDVSNTEVAESTETLSTDGTNQVENAVLSPSQTEKLVFSSENKQIITTALIGEEAQYIIPVTLVFPSSDQSVESYYNQLDSYMNTEELGLVSFPMEGWTFELKPEQQQVIATIPEAYEFPQGSAFQSKLEGVLAHMFGSQNIDEVLFQTSEGEGVSLGAIGDHIESLSVTEEGKNAYKYYQTAEGSELLVPISLEEKTTIQQAVEEMKIQEDHPAVTASIPETVSVTVEDAGEELKVSIQEENTIGDNKETQQILEAVLMTAKSFGYQSVSFDLPVSQVGSYQTDKPVSVPSAANPFVSQ